MIETLPERPAPAELRLPTAVSAAFTAFRRGIAGRSQIVWGEHCSECAYPSCYAHCAFYTPRSDYHCRRFEGGLEPLTGDAGLHRVRFRKWGKLEGKGPVALVPIAEAQARAGREDQLSALISALPVPHAVKVNLAWRRNTSKAAAKAVRALKADAFVVEVWAADGGRHPFTLTLLNVDDHGGRLFQTRFEADAGYRRLVVPIADIAAQVDLDAPFLVQIEPVGEAEGVQAVFGLCDFVKLADAAVLEPRLESLAPPVALSKPAKVVVWDLDETLWTGVLAEDGVEGVSPRPEAVAAVRLLDERGVLQSVASKNDAAEAMAALQTFGLADYFLHPQIHWRPKSGSVGAVAKALDLGLDSVVFIDDQPFERSEVASVHPTVRTLAHTEVAALGVHPWFDLPVTAESRQRRALYRQEARRVEAYETAGQDYAGFLRSSEIKLTVNRIGPADIERVYELSQRTNQLNFNGRKYAREAVQALAGGASRETGLCLRCSDRFGDYGLIGFAVVDCAEGLVTDLFMSCRVQRKRVEHAFIAWLCWGMAKRGVTQIRIAHTPTGRNGAAREMLEALGFAPSTDAEWARPAAEPIAESDIVAVVARSAALAA